MHTPAYAQSDTMAAVAAVDLVKVYGSGDTAVRALDGVTVGFAGAQFTAIMGASGSGKSTVLSFLRDSVRELGQTVVMVTHDPGAAAYADRVVLLADGRVAGELDRPDRASVTAALQDLAATR
jgi:ABC-type lipoprotein export system ATPase subunit